ncbi:MAG: glycosyltransferase [Clostridiaceae bacterium]
MNLILRETVLVLNYLLLFAALAGGTAYFIELCFSAVKTGKYVRSLSYVDYRRFLDSEHMVPVSLIVSARNAAGELVETVNNLLTLDFPQYELIVVNDGSDDDTLARLIQAFGLLPFQQPYRKLLETGEIHTVYRAAKDARLIVLDKARAGRADALNAGINLSSYPVIVAANAGVRFEKSALLKIMYSFVSDPSCVAVGGMVRLDCGQGTGQEKLSETKADKQGEKIEEKQSETTVGKQSGTREEKQSETTVGKQSGTIEEKQSKIKTIKKPVIALRTVANLRARMTGRLGYHLLGVHPLVPVAFCALNKAVVVEAGGYAPDCAGEDMELLLRVHTLLQKKKKKYAVRFLPDPVCRVCSPERLTDDQKLQKRLQLGLIDGLRAHRRMALRAAYGKIGMFCLPYYWLFGCAAPVLEAFTLVFVALSCTLGIVSVWFMVSFYLMAALCRTVLSAGALLTEENTFLLRPNPDRLLRLFFYAVMENVGFRQISAFSRTFAILGYRAEKNRWRAQGRPDVFEDLLKSTEKTPKQQH